MEIKRVIPEKRIFVMTDDEIRENPFITEDRREGFYRFLAGQFGSYDDVKSIDCRKVCVADNVMKSWYDAADNFIPPIDQGSLSMQICINGPKIDKELKDNEVLLEEGWIEWNEEGRTEKTEEGGGNDGCML